MWKEEWQKLRKMKFGEKIEYLWNNYMAQIVLIFFLLIVLVVAGNFIYQKLHPNTDLEIALLDYDGLASVIEEDGLVLETFQGLSAETMQSPDYEGLRMGVMARIATGDMDAMIASRETIEQMQENAGEAFLSLSDIYPKEDLADRQEDILYLTDDAGNAYAVGISLADAKCLQDVSNKPQDIYLVFCCNSDQTEGVKAWLQKQSDF